MKIIAKYIPGERLIKIKKEVIRLNRENPSGNEYRNNIKNAIRQELSPEEITELATIFDATIEDLASYVATSFLYDAVELRDLLKIPLDDAVDKVRGVG